MSHGSTDLFDDIAVAPMGKCHPELVTSAATSAATSAGALMPL
jgi:hypothetical protein